MVATTDGGDKGSAGCPYRLSTDWRLFLKKTLFVVVLSYALVPLIAYKQKIPAALFTAGLVVLHVLILVVYVYKVRIRQLDPDWRAFSGRLVAIAFALWLLDLATRLEGGRDILVLCANMLVLCLAHCFVLALLTVRVVHIGGQPLLPVAVPITPTEPLTFRDQGEDRSQSTSAAESVARNVTNCSAEEAVEHAQHDEKAPATASPGASEPRSPRPSE